jgi:hypothetical protein
MKFVKFYWCYKTENPLSVSIFFFVLCRTHYPRSCCVHVSWDRAAFETRVYSCILLITLTKSPSSFTKLYTSAIFSLLWLSLYFLLLNFPPRPSSYFSKTVTPESFKAMLLTHRHYETEKKNRERSWDMDSVWELLRLWDITRTYVESFYTEEVLRLFLTVWLFLTTIAQFLKKFRWTACLQMLAPPSSRPRSELSAERR